MPSSMPFCCYRCRLADLSRWMNEEIGLPHEGGEEDEPEEPQQVREIRFD